MQTVQLSDGFEMPKMGQGTWLIGDDPRTRAQEIEALRVGVDRGLTLIDTAEMYGNGRSERLVGEAISDRRDEVFLVSKVTPGADREQTIRACEASLRRLGTDRLDLYLLHWAGGDFEDTVEAFQQLRSDGKILNFGVSNLDYAQLRRFRSISGGEQTRVNQLLFNLVQRGIERDLLPWMQGEQMATMAYSPFDRGDLLADSRLQDFARERQITPGQAALAWLLTHEGVIPIPKASHRDRVQENIGALDVSLSSQDLAELDRLFPPPDGPQELAIY